MTCYLKKLGPQLAKAGYPNLSKEQRKVADRTVKVITGATGKCPQVWQQVQKWLKEPGNEDMLIKELHSKLVE